MSAYLMKENFGCSVKTKEWWKVYLFQSSAPNNWISREIRHVRDWQSCLRISTKWILHEGNAFLVQLG